MVVFLGLGLFVFLVRPVKPGLELSETRLDWILSYYRKCFPLFKVGQTREELEKFCIASGNLLSRSEQIYRFKDWSDLAIRVKLEPINSGNDWLTDRIIDISDPFPFNTWYPSDIFVISEPQPERSKNE